MSIFRFPENAHTREYLKDFPLYAKEYEAKPIASLTYSKFRLFRDNGSRIEYENDYFDRRRRLDVMFGMVMSGKDEYVAQLEDIICAICDEFTWSLPAHIRPGMTVEQQKTNIDLFSSETAFALSEILFILNDVLDCGVCERMRHEIMRRVINPYISEPVKWGKNNWSAVCIAGVAAAFYYLGLKSEFEKVKADIIGSFEKFLESYEDDGCCLEGALYWSYGFGYFVYGSDILKKLTDGETDLFKLDKVRKIAGFGMQSYLFENCTVPYSDAPHRLNFNVGLYHYLKKEYPELPLPDKKFEAKFGDESRFRFAEFYRNIVWYNELSDTSAPGALSCDYTSSQWFFRRRKKYSFSAKGGHNDEPHNHNDVGSFVVVSARDGCYLLDDPGWQEYDGKYFNPEYRYTKYICSMSQGHSLPIINGKGQAAGLNHAAKLVSVNENKIVLDISEAYDIKGLKFVRTYLLDDDSLTITDEISGADTVTERFVTQANPEISGNGVILGESVFSPCGRNETGFPKLAHENYYARAICLTGSEPISCTANFIDYECAVGENKHGIYSFKIKL